MEVELNSNYLHQLRDYTILLEYSNLKNQVPSGIYVIPSLENILTWHGVIFIHRGRYRDGVFKFFIDFPIDYPKIQPKIFFYTKVYNPMVNYKTGEVDLSTSKKTSIIHNLAYLKWFFFLDDLWSIPNPFNPESLNLWQNDPIKFEIKCQECVQSSIAHRYDNPSGFLLSFDQKIADSPDSKLLEAIYSNNLTLNFLLDHIV